MKKKTLNSILLIIVLGIWAKVIYNYLQRYNTNPVAVTNYSDRTDKLFTVEKKSFDLHLLERDPFLNKTKVRKTTPRNTIKRAPKKEVVKNIKWPSISYLGFVKNKNANNSKLAILKVDGNIQNIKEGAYFNKEIYINKIYKDSIKVTFNNQIKIIKK